MTAVSAVVPVYNGAGFLPAAVATIRAQAVEGLEIVVVDDGSTDETPGVAAALSAADPAMRVVRTANRGPSAARNAGIEAARGAIIAFLDVDDEWTPGRMGLMLGRLAAGPELDVVYGKIEVVCTDPDDSHWRRLRIEAGGAISPLIGSGVYRRRAFERIGGFDETMRFGEDLDWFLRALEARLALRILDRVVLRYVLHRTNVTRDRAAVQRSVADTVRRSMIRRRRKGDQSPLPLMTSFLEAVPDDR
ncbi:MAG: glycosyltransferase family 2 protein [Alphaproteobacteria bacterium]